MFLAVAFGLDLASLRTSLIYIPTDTMAAETAPAPAAAPAASGPRPQKPDENVFKTELAAAEKAHKAAMDRLVRLTPHGTLNG